MRRSGASKMKVKYNNQELELFSKGVPDKIMLSLSGGLDSASLLFLICKHIPQVQIIPFTGKDKYAPFDFVSSQMILQWMQDRFPDNNIQEHEWFEFDVQDPDLRAAAEAAWEKEKVMVNGKLVERCGRLSGLVKILEIRKFTMATWHKHKRPLIVNGMTGNPPVEEMKAHGFYDLRERRRDEGNPVKQYGGINYQPFVLYDKKFVADIYYQNDIMDLYELTSSCVGSAAKTNYFSEPCNECFWCHEKKWAFSK